MEKTEEKISEVEETEQQNLTNLNNREKKDRKKKMSRASGNCETVTKDLTFKGRVTEGEDDKEIMFENFPIFCKRQNLVDLRS